MSLSDRLQPIANEIVENDYENRLKLKTEEYSIFLADVVLLIDANVKEYIHYIKNDFPQDLRGSFMREKNNNVIHFRVFGNQHVNVSLKIDIDFTDEKWIFFPSVEVLANKCALLALNDNRYNRNVELTTIQTGGIEGTFESIIRRSLKGSNRL